MKTSLKMAYRWKSGIVLLFLHGHDLVFDPKTLALLSRKAARSGILSMESGPKEEVSFQTYLFFLSFLFLLLLFIRSLSFDWRGQLSPRHSYTGPFKYPQPTFQGRGPSTL